MFLTRRDGAPMFPKQIEPQRDDVEVLRTSMLVIVHSAQHLIDLLPVVVSDTEPLQCVDEVQLPCQVVGGGGVHQDPPHILSLGIRFLLHVQEL